jgi:hypothetical protein
MPSLISKTFLLLMLSLISFAVATVHNNNAGWFFEKPNVRIKIKFDVTR